MPNTKVYVFEVEADRPPRTFVHVEMRGDATLHDLHAVIDREFALDAGDEYTFFRSGVYGDERTAFEGPGAEGDFQAESTRLERLALRVGTQIAHADFGDPARVQLARVLAVRGDALSWKENVTLRGQKMEARLVGEIAEWMRRVDDLPDPMQETEIDSEREERGRAYAELARGILAWADGDDAMLDQVSTSQHPNPLAWMVLLPRQLAIAGLHDAAVRIADQLLRHLDSPSMRADRAFALARSGRREEAEAALAELLTEAGDDPWVNLRAAEVHRSLQNHERALELYQRAKADPDCDESALFIVLHHLRDLLEEMGRHDESSAMGPEIHAWHARRESQETQDARAEALLDGGASIGRNDPCPCGSGKKYKKCCGAAQTRAPKLEAVIAREQYEALTNSIVTEDHFEAFARGLPLFCGALFEGLTPGEALPLLPTEDIEAALLEWFVLDRASHATATLADTYAKKHGARLTERERSVLERLRRSHLALYAIGERDDQRFMLRDVFTGTEVQAWASDLVDFDSDEKHLLARLIELDGKYVMLGGVVPVPADLVAAIELEMRAVFDDVEANAGIDAADRQRMMWKREGHRAARIVLEGA